MYSCIEQRHPSIIYRFLCLFISVAMVLLTIQRPACAQTSAPLSYLNLPAPGTMVTLSPAYTPVLLKGMTLYPDDPLKFDFIVDSGHTNFAGDELKTESERLVRYFLASMTIPENDLWVNLSPHEGDRIIPDELVKTELGRDLLAQDYILKQLSASLIYPEDDLGSKFWQKVYQKAQDLYGTTEIPVNTFNKVWIVPESATVYEHEQTVYVVESKLKVLMDADYLAMSKSKTVETSRWDVSKSNSAPETSQRDVSTDIIRKIILPEIEKEINQGQNFAPLRQIYHSLILAQWYKKTIKESLLSKVYIDQNKMGGIDNSDESVKEQIYAQYIEAYKQGVFDFIKEEYDQLSQQKIPKQYFSGGIKGAEVPLRNASITPDMAKLTGIGAVLSVVLGEPVKGINGIAAAKDIPSVITENASNLEPIQEVTHSVLNFFNTGILAESLERTARFALSFGIIGSIALLLIGAVILRDLILENRFLNDPRWQLKYLLKERKFGKRMIDRPKKGLLLLNLQQSEDVGVDRRHIDKLLMKILGNKPWITIPQKIDILIESGAEARTIKEVLFQSYKYSVKYFFSPAPGEAGTMQEHINQLINPLEQREDKWGLHVLYDLLDFLKKYEVEAEQEHHEAEQQTYIGLVTTAIQRIHTTKPYIRYSKIELKARIYEEVAKPPNLESIESRYTSGFDSKVPYTWVKRRISADSTSDSTKTTIKRAGDYKIRHNPTIPLAPISEEQIAHRKNVIAPYDESEFVSDNAVYRRLMELELKTDGQTLKAQVQVNDPAEFMYHIRLLPEVGERRPQQILDRHILMLLKLREHSDSSNMTFYHDSWGGGEEVNHLNVHGVPLDERLPIEDAELTPIIDHDEITIQGIESFGARAFLFSGDDLAVAQQAGYLMRLMRVQNVPYNFIMNDNGLYVITRMPEAGGAVEFMGQSYPFKALDMAGLVNVTDEYFNRFRRNRGQANAQISAAIASATAPLDVYEKLKSHLVEDVYSYKVIGINPFPTVPDSLYYSLNQVARPAVLQEGQWRGSKQDDVYTFSASFKGKKIIVRSEAHIGEEEGDALGNQSIIIFIQSVDAPSWSLLSENVSLVDTAIMEDIKADYIPGWASLLPGLGFTREEMITFYIVDKLVQAQHYVEQGLFHLGDTPELINGVNQKLLEVISSQIVDIYSSLGETAKPSEVVEIITHMASDPKNFNDALRTANKVRNKALSLSNQLQADAIDVALAFGSSNNILINIGKEQLGTIVNSGPMFDIAMNALVAGSYTAEKIIDVLIQQERRESFQLQVAKDELTQTEFTPGGIDLNEITVNRQGHGIHIQFSGEALEPYLHPDFKGFMPIIINMTPINSILPLLGLKPRKDEEEGIELSKAG